MADSTLTVSQVEEEGARRVTALDASQFNQGASPKVVPAAWTEHDSFSPRGGGPTPVAHLGFSANVETSPNSNRERDTDAGRLRIRSRLVITFRYRLRPGDELVDSRLARDAAHDVLKAINAPTAEWNCEIVNAGQPLFAADQSFLLVSVFFDIVHEIEV